MDKDRGSFTVEAAFIMLIILAVIILIYYAAEYAYERAILQAVTAFEMESAAEKQLDRNEIKTKLKKELSSRLKRIRIKKVEIQDGILKRKAKVSYAINIKSNLLKKIWMKGKSRIEFIWEKEWINPLHYLWDFIKQE